MSLTRVVLELTATYCCPSLLSVCLQTYPSHRSNLALACASAARSLSSSNVCNYVLVFCWVWTLVYTRLEKGSSAAEVLCMKILFTFGEIFFSPCVLVVFFENFMCFGSKNTHLFFNHLGSSFGETARYQQLIWYVVSQIFSIGCCKVKCTGYFSNENSRNDLPGVVPQS